MASTTYGNGIIKAALVGYLSTATVKAMLVDGTYVPDVDAHDFRADVTGEVSGTGYTAGGVTLTNVAVTYDAATNRIKLDADDADFGELTVSGIAGIVVYVDTGSAATDVLIGHHSFAASSPSAQNFSYQWNADGMGYITV